VDWLGDPVKDDRKIETWRLKAEELRTTADNCRSYDAQRAFRRLADQYELLADRTEASADAARDVTSIA
jgi:hypothetical protein